MTNSRVNCDKCVKRERGEDPEFCNVTRSFSRFFNVSFLSQPPTVTHGETRRKATPSGGFMRFQRKVKGDTRYAAVHMSRTPVVANFGN